VDKELKVVGVDLGGTKVNAGLVIGSSVRKSFKSILSFNDTSTSVDVVISNISDAIGRVFEDGVEGIGIGVPSIVNRKEGTIYDAQNITSWKEVALGPILQKKFGVPVFLDNDANCFAIGERFYGKGQKYENFVGLTIGTGLGGGIINGGYLLKDENCMSGEFGELYYLDSKAEDYCSGHFFREKYHLDGADLYKNAENGDKEALKIFAEFGYHLGRVIKMIITSIDPQAIVIGGSIVGSRKFFETSMRAEIKKFTYARASEKLIIEFSENAVDAPVLGAAAVCMNNLKL